MTSNKKKLMLCGLLGIGLAGGSMAQTPVYSVNGTGGTAGGSSSVNVLPGVSPSGSSSLTDLGASTQFGFGTGVDGTAGHSIMNSATGQPGAGVLAGTLGASSSFSAFTVTLWVNQSTATLNNYRYLEIAPGSPATTGSGDGNRLFLGLNAGGGIQFYVNNVNNNFPEDVAGANSWNNGGTLGALAANTWYFVAVTYDAVAGSSLLYSGSQSSATTLAYTYGSTVTSAGNLDLSSASSLALMDRFSGGRNFPGAIDDVNIYGGALTQSQLDAIRIAQLTPAPEPGTLALAGLGGAVMLAAFRRRCN
jgi:hypothetical protein